jgi:hypothetical protein
MVKDATLVKAALERLGLSKPTLTTLVVYASHDVAVPSAQVWDAWKQLDAWPRWQKSLLSQARWLEKRDFEFGATFQQVRHFGFPIGRQVTVETVREVVPGSSVSWWDGRGGARSCHTWYFETLPNGGTRIHRIEVFVGFIALFGRPFYRRFFKRFNESVQALGKLASST